MKNNNAKLLLHKLFQNCLSSGLSPTEWDSSSIKPIPKKDSDGRDPLQNRCITIICCVSKIYAKILNKRLQKYLELNNILVDEQNGFRASRSCIDHILVLCTILRNRKSVGLDTFLAFIDFKKAFESVDRSLLLFKLSEIGIRGNFYKAISSMYSNPRSRVILNNEYATDYFDCPIGVKQGCCLSPTLFSIFLNDLAVEIKESGIFLELNNILMESSKAANQTLSSSILFINILLYADDIVFIAKNENDLQDLLFIVENWCLKWILEVNLAKTNIMHVRSARKSQSNYFFLFNRRPVPYCKYYKYLGFTINEQLNFSDSNKILSDSAGKALSVIISKMIKNKGFPYNVFSLLLNSCVNSICDYAGEVTGFSEYSSKNKIFLRAARSFLGLPKNCPIPPIIAEIGWLSPVYRTQLKMVRQFNRVLSMPDNRLTKQIVRWDENFSSFVDCQTWSKEIKNIFSANNLDIYYQNNSAFNTKHVIDKLSNSMLYKQQSDQSLLCQTYSKLKYYVMFKDFNKPSIFLEKPLSFLQRKNFCKAIFGILPINEELLRYSYPIVPAKNRFCDICKKKNNNNLFITSGLTQVSNEVLSENLEHVCFICPEYADIRHTWLSQLNIPGNFDNLPVENKFNLIFNVPDNVKPTSKFITLLLDKRSLFNSKYKK